MLKKIMQYLETMITNICEKICNVLHILPNEKQMQTIIQFIKFGIVGVSNTLLSYLIYILCITCGIHYLAASVIGFIVSVCNSYYWNSKYVFQTTDKGVQNQIQSFLKMLLSYAFTGLLLQNILLIVFVEVINISKYSAPFILLIITIPLNFIMNKIWAFRKKKHSK